MEEKVAGKTKRLRLGLHLGSLAYLSILLGLILNQQRMLENIFNQHFRLSFSNVLVFFTSANWAEKLTHNVELLAQDLLFLIVVEVLIVIIGLGLIGWLFWRLRKWDKWHLSEKIIGIGYLFLVLSLVFILTKMVNTSYDTYMTINGSLTSLSFSEIQAIQEAFRSIILESNINLNNIVAGILVMVEEINKLIQTTKEIKDIPNLLSQTWQALLVLKNWLIGCSMFAVLLVLGGHLLEGINQAHLIQKVKEKFKRTKKQQQVDLNQRLTEVVEQQAQLIQALTEKNQAE